MVVLNAQESAVFCKELYILNFKNDSFRILSYVYERFPCLGVCVTLVCLVPTEVRRVFYNPWNWSYR